MQPDEYIIDQLGYDDKSDDEKELALEQVRVAIGEAISEQISEEQGEEYQAIIDANNDVIYPWLAKHFPEYKKTLVYQQIEEASHSDPQHNDPAKIFANLAWIQVNVPNTKEITDKVIAEFKKNSETTS